MATTGPYYSTEYTTLYSSNPAVPGNSSLHSNIWGGGLFRKKFTYTQAALGTAGDLVYLVKVPANCVVIMALSMFKFSAWDNSPTLDVGWLAYNDTDGDAISADENGLMDGVDISAAGHVFGGALILAASAVAQAYIVDEKEFDSNDEVTITATLADQAPSADDTLTGWIAYSV